MQPFRQLNTTRHRSRTTAVVAAQQEREVGSAQQVCTHETRHNELLHSCMLLGACDIGHAHGGNIVCWVTQTAFASLTPF